MRDEGTFARGDLQGHRSVARYLVTVEDQCLLSDKQSQNPF